MLEEEKAWDYIAEEWMRLISTLRGYIIELIVNDEENTINEKS